MQDRTGSTSSFERDEAAFCVTEPSELVTVLNEIQAERKLVLLLSSGPKIAATLLDVNPTSGQLIFDAGRNQEEIQAILTAEKLRFLANVRGIAVRFWVPRPVETSFAGGPAFLTPLPLEITYLQRRRFYRASIRLNRVYSCRVRLPDQTEAELRIQDISVGGVRLHSNTLLPERLPVGTVLPGAVLDFLEMGKLEMTMRVVSHAKTSNEGIPNYLYGCQFQRVPRGKDAAIQKLVFTLERLNHSLSGRL